MLFRFIAIAALIALGWWLLSRFAPGLTRNPRTRLVLGTALAVGAATAIAGTIGFLGLVVPHLLRPLVAHRPGALLVPSALGGAVLLLAADIAVRLPFPRNELKLGVLTALVGGPFFLWLIVAYRRQLS